MKKLTLLLWMLLSISLVYGQETEKEKDIHRLLEVSGSGDLGVQVMQNMITNFQQSYDGVPEVFWQKLMEEVTAVELTNMIVPIYDKHFSHEDIKAFIAFYETPAGQRLVAKLPVVMQESMVIGQAWGQELAQKILDKMREEGYIKN